MLYGNIRLPSQWDSGKVRFEARLEEGAAARGSREDALSAALRAGSLRAVLLRLRASCQNERVLLVLKPG